MMIQLNRTGNTGARTPRASRYRLVATLAVLSLTVLSAAPAMAGATQEPVPDLIQAPAGQLVSLSPHDLFEVRGSKPRFTDAFFPIRDYLEEGYISTDSEQGTRLLVKVKSADALNALPSPPSSPIFTTATVTKTNDEGQTSTRNVTFETRYRRTASFVHVPGHPPTLSRQTPFLAPPGSRLGIFPRDVFDNAGTNPVFTDVTFSTTDYYRDTRIADAPASEYHGIIILTVKYNDALNALPTPPPNPIEVTAKVTMTNDEEQTATATVTISTEYLRDAIDQVDPLHGGGEDGG